MGYIVERGSAILQAIWVIMGATCVDMSILFRKENAQAEIYALTDYQIYVNA